MFVTILARKESDNTMSSVGLHPGARRDEYVSEYKREDGTIGRCHYLETITAQRSSKPQPWTL